MSTAPTRDERVARKVPAAPVSVTEDAVAEVLELEEQPTDVVVMPDPETRYEMICTAAYFIAEQRGFAPGHELADWFAAERAVDRLVREHAGEG